MMVPKASMNENNRAVAWQYDVWPPWQALSVQPETITQTMENRPHDQFRLCIAP